MTSTDPPPDEPTASDPRDSDTTGEAASRTAADRGAADAGRRERHVVELLRGDGTASTVTVAGDETILEATARAGTELRHGCREGRCVSCTARLLSGSVTYEVDPQALGEDLRERGFVLLCVARPASDCLLEVGRNVLSDAFPQLWRTESGVAYVEELRDAQAALPSGTPDGADAAVSTGEYSTTVRNELEGALAPFENLKQVREAFVRAGRRDAAPDEGRPE